jgi:hypothetical protein
VHNFHACATGIVRGSKPRRLASNPQLTLVRLMYTRYGLHKRRFSRPIISDKRDDFAIRNLKIQSLQRVHMTIAFVDIRGTKRYAL